MAKKTKAPETNLVQDLEELCVEIFAHAENYYEVTLSGNGTNPCEASNAAHAVLDILHGDGRKWREDNEKRVQKRAAELRKKYGE